MALSQAEVEAEEAAIHFWINSEFVIPIWTKIDTTNQLDPKTLNVFFENSEKSNLQTIL